MTIEDDAEFDEIDRLLAAPRRERDREELARRRSARRRTLDMLECVPATHDVDRCIVIAVRRFLEARGVKKPGDLIDVDTSAARDPSAAALVDRIVEAIKNRGSTSAIAAPAIACGCAWAWLSQCSLVLAQTNSRDDIALRIGWTVPAKPSSVPTERRRLSRRTWRPNPPPWTERIRLDLRPVERSVPLPRVNFRVPFPNVTDCCAGSCGTTPQLF